MKKFLTLLCCIVLAFVAVFAVACDSESTAIPQVADGNSAANTTDYTATEQSILTAAAYDFTSLSADTEIPEDAVEVPSSSAKVNLTGGVYVLNGEYSAGIEITAETDVHIYLSGATVSNTKKAFSVSKGDTDDDVSVIITVVGDTVNAITSTTKNAFDSDILTYINGSGTLNVVSNGNNGVKVNSSLVIVDATINITSANQGVSAHSLTAKDCTINVLAAAKDGIHAEMDDEITAWTSSDGYVALFNVNFTASVQGDGIQADTFVYIDGGEYDITTQGEFVSYSEWQSDSENYDLTTDDFKYAKSGSDVYTKKASKTINNSNITSLYALVQSSKGIKVGEIDYETDGTEYTVADGDYYIIIVGGNFTINSSDDAIHVNSGNLTVNGGTFAITTLDDGLTSDLLTKINGGTITVYACFEGIEGGQVVINGGTITLTCNDDGINASSDDAAVSKYITVTGGTVIVNAQGDGIDSNGTAEISGGTVYVFGPTAGGNSALDSEGSVLISGGTVVAISKEAMDGITCNKPYVSATNVSLSNGNTVAIDGVVNLTVLKGYSGATVIICSENLTSGTAYTLKLGTTSKTVTATTGSQGGMGGFGGNGGFGGMPNGGTGGKQRP